MATKGKDAPKRKYTRRSGDTKLQDKDTAQDTADNPVTGNVFNVDDETWTRILQAAAQGQISPADVMKQSVVNAYGRQAPEGAWHSGQPNDPSLNQ
jgi:hypothetical protein